MNKTFQVLQEQLAQPLPAFTPEVITGREQLLLTLMAQEVYWSKPYGEPVWVEIPAGETTIGNPQGQKYEQPVHTLTLPTFYISPLPITNAQYQLFLQATDHREPFYWGYEHPSHPVTGVTLLDAVAYSDWLGQVTGKKINLPSELEWEKAAGGPEHWAFPWGNHFDTLRCNHEDLEVEGTTPAGLFPPGAYGLMDMAGNVQEWTRSQFRPYPYMTNDGREELNLPTELLVEGQKEHLPTWVLRGGHWHEGEYHCRTTSRAWDLPTNGSGVAGFRVVWHK